MLPTTFFAGFCVSGGQKSLNALAVIFYPTAVLCAAAAIFAMGLRYDSASRALDRAHVELEDATSRT